MRDCPYSPDSYIATIRQLHRSRLTALTPLYRHFIGFNLPGLSYSTLSPCWQLRDAFRQQRLLHLHRFACLLWHFWASLALAWYPYRRLSHHLLATLSQYRPWLNLFSISGHSSPSFASAALEFLANQTHPPRVCQYAKVLLIWSSTLGNVEK